jgi:hypothetical protein
MAAYDEICTPDDPTITLIIFGAVLLVWGALVLYFLNKRGTRKRAVIAFAFVAVPILAFVGLGLFKQASRFDGYAVGGDGLTLRYPWPKGDVFVAFPTIRGVRVEREEYVTHGKSGSGVHERGWVIVDADDKHRSCRTAGFPRLVAGGKAIAASVGKPPEWNVRCKDDRKVATTEVVISAAAATDYQGLCGTAKSPSDLR